MQDLFRRKGAQELHILKDISGVLKPVSGSTGDCVSDSDAAEALCMASTV
jgi:hypothetical protein